MHNSLLPLLICATSIGACSMPATEEIVFDGSASDEDSVGKADLPSLPMRTIVGADIGGRASDGGLAILTSEAHYQAYFGADAPADVDFESEWLVFYGTGIQSSDGYSATISGITQRGRVLFVDVHARAPGVDCVVTQAISFPHHLVAIAIPDFAPFYYKVDASAEVYSCGSPDPCTQVDELELVPAISFDLDDYNDGCNPVGAWCSLSRADGFELPVCLATEPTLAELVAVADFDSMYPVDFSYGLELDRTQLESSGTFTRSSAGLTLLSTIDAWAGSVSLRAWLLESEVPCHNCTERLFFQLLHYPDTGRVVLLEGITGFDS